MRAHVRTLWLDKKLISHLPDPLKEGRALKDALYKWAEEQNNELRAELATDLFSLLLEKASKKLGIFDEKWYESNAEESHVRKIAKNINNFEDLIGHVRTKFRGKVYRDHLHHMMRTALIASYLADRLDIGNSDKLDLVVASLIHDIGYPVQEAGRIVSDVADAAGAVCALFSFGEAKASIQIKGYTKGLLHLCGAVGIEYDEVVDLLERKEPEHAAIGALEFLKHCQDPWDRPLRIASAILLHDSSLGGDFSYDDCPIAVVLAIADELQEWGRPIAIPDRPKEIQLTAPKVWRNRDSDGGLNIFEFEYETDDHPLISAIYNKWLNLRRFKVEGLPIRMEMRFPLETTSLQIHKYVKPSDEICDIVKHVRLNPWRIKVRSDEERHIRLTHSQVEERTGLSKDSVRSAREILVQNRTLENRRFQWSLWRQGNSFDFIVAKAKPIALDLVTDDDVFKVRTTYEGTARDGSYFDKLVYLNKEKPEKRFMVPLPVVISLHYNFQARVYWFDVDRNASCTERINPSEELEEEFD